MAATVRQLQQVDARAEYPGGVLRQQRRPVDEPVPEGRKAETRQGGFNANAHDLLFKQDSFQLKAVYFETRIKNYISSQTYGV